MPNEIVGTLSISHDVDPTGSLAITVPFKVLPAKLAPELSLSYHSASKSVTSIGVGFALKGLSSIERCSPLFAKDGCRGTVNYDKNDHYSLNGQRLVHIGDDEYRYEIDQWSKIVANGSDPGNPDYWVEYLGDGSTRTYGKTPDSNIKAVGQKATRVWAANEHRDAFTNYITYSYTSDAKLGAYYIKQIQYGGNQKTSMSHQRSLVFDYETRPDIRTGYVGGSVVSMNQRLVGLTASFKNKLAHKHVFKYDQAPLTNITRLISLALEDSVGDSVRPLLFNWVNASPEVFDPVVEPLDIEVYGSKALMMTMDVNATGRSDVVIASQHLVNDEEKLHIAVHASDGTGKIPVKPTSTFESMAYPKHLFPLEFNGDGRTDMLHIEQFSEKFVLTVLLSKTSGYSPQTPLDFSPDSMDGTFYLGDFVGNGRIGLVYVYSLSRDGVAIIKYVQFVSDGEKFKALDPCDGPEDITTEKLRVVVADVNGDGAEDLIFFHPRFVDDAEVCHIEYIESKDGQLAYRSDQPLAAAGKDIFWTNEITFLPYSAEDDDGKTSFVVASNDGNGSLQLNFLRSTGKGLLPPQKPIKTDIPYDGNISLAKTCSSNTVDIITTFEESSDRAETTVSVLRFVNGGFEVVRNVKQPRTSSSFVLWSDVRGMGRSDCLLNTFNHVDRKFRVVRMPPSQTQPVDFMSGYENGLGAKFSVLYSPLSDPSTYTANASSSPLSAVNAGARNVAPTAKLSAAHKPRTTARTRSQLVHFPAYVVKQYTSTPYAAEPNVAQKKIYTYMNARYAFDGRGWLGFENIKASLPVTGTTISTTYYQEFPFIGVVRSTKVSNTATQEAIQETAHEWKALTSPVIKGTYVAFQASCKESYFEKGTLAYSAEATYGHDDFGNIKSISVKSPQAGSQSLSIQATYENNISSGWIVGNKTSEVLREDDQILQQAKYTYAPFSRNLSSTSHWVSGDTWATKQFALDDTGNEVTISGPGPALRKYTYDETSSFVSTSTVSTGPNSSLVEASVFDPISGKPLSTTMPNGRKTEISYDVLGRQKQVAIGGDGVGMAVVRKQEYTRDANQYYFTVMTNTLKKDSPLVVSEKVFIDGLERARKTMKPRPDSSTEWICRDTGYDVDGRLVSRSRSYLSTEKPMITTYKYDPHSRVISESAPPVAPGQKPVITSIQYDFSGGLMRNKEARSDGSSGNRTVQRGLRYLPSSDPSPGKLLKPYVVESTNEVGEAIKSSFDLLGRVRSVADPSQATLSLNYDGLSRLVSRSISMSGPKGRRISQMLYAYSADQLEHTATNELGGSKVVTKFDWSSRPISRVSPEETLTYKYDEGAFAKGQLSSVLSSQSFNHSYAYNIYGQPTSTSLTMDKDIYKMSHDWTLGGQLLQATNPDGSKLRNTLLSDGVSVNKVELLDDKNAIRASANLSDYKDVYGRPTQLTYGNGIKASTSFAYNGCVSSIALSKGTQQLYHQSWNLDPFGGVAKYSVGGGAQINVNDGYENDPAGQLTRFTSGGSSETYSYDACGNLTGKGTKKFEHDGWQLTKVVGPSGALEASFQYSKDGNVTAKLDRNGKASSTMKYDSQGRLTQLNGTTFAYDYTGQLLKAKFANGNTRIYPNQYYDVEATPAGGSTHTSYLFHKHRLASVSTVVSPKPAARPPPPQPHGLFGIVGTVVGTVGEVVHDVIDIVLPFPHAPPPGATTQTNIYYNHVNNQGSIVAASDTSGKITTQYTYDPHGALVQTKGPDVSRYKFSGKEAFEGMYYFGARFYDPSVSRFLTLDDYPLSLERLTPSKFNMYAFSANDPINYVDVNGNAPWWHWLVDAALIVVGVALSFVPGGAAVVALAGAALLGGGLAGFAHDISNPSGSDADWAIQIGIGAVIGAVSGGAGRVLDKVLPQVSAKGLSAFSGAARGRLIMTYAVRTTARFAGTTAIGSATNAVTQISNNAIAGKAWDDGLGTAAAEGAMAGFFAGALSEFKGAWSSPAGGDKWWGSRAGQYRVGGNPKPNITNPLKQRPQQEEFFDIVMNPVRKGQAF